jgi:hypothetical protein
VQRKAALGLFAAEELAAQRSVELVYPAFVVVQGLARARLAGSQFVMNPFVVKTAVEAQKSAPSFGQRSETTRSIKIGSLKRDVCGDKLSFPHSISG